mmetsp:Transcript_90493/g.230162  ORF Transcript_90493/g.230162 Transcript_90493/m.230162 type:complete len:319 (+) Transcript_90493:55-1011(+)
MTEGGIQDLRPRERRGIVYDKWPFRLDIAVEYQDWILICSCLFVVFLWTLPCVCGRLQNSCSRAFANWVYTRLHVFYWTLVYVTLFMIMFTIGILPDWSGDDFADYSKRAMFWTLDRMVKIITSLSILFGFYLVFKFRERVLVAAGMEHITVFSWKMHDPLGFRSKLRPVEVYIWKVDNLRSGNSKVLKANDIFIECHLGQNQPMRTRVHNNAGQGCIIKESFQLNIDENEPSQLMTMLLKDQSILTTHELARLSLSTAELCGIEDQTGKRRTNFTYSVDHFVPLGLSPQGQVWIAVAPVDDIEDAKAFDEGSLACGC